MTEDRIVEIEIKVTRLEDQVDEMNKVIYRQQMRIEQLAEVIVALARRLAEAGINGNELGSISEKPPHY